MNNVTIVNLTPHDLNMVEGATYPRTEVFEGRFLTVRASQKTEEVGTVTCNGVIHTVSKSTFGKPYFCTVDTKGQDEQPFEGTVPEADYYVVSILALQAIHKMDADESEDWMLNNNIEESEFLAPGKLVRDAEGKIVGSTGFSIL